MASRAELQEQARAVLAALDEVQRPQVLSDLSARLVESMVRMEDASGLRELIALDGGWRRRAESRKMGNVVLSVRGFLSAAAGAGLAIAGAAEVPWLLPLAAIAVWGYVCDSSVPLSEREAAVIWVIWHLRDSEDRVPKQGLLEQVNRELSGNGRRPISPEELADTLAALSRIRTIRDLDDSWEVLETVRVPFFEPHDNSSD